MLLVTQEMESDPYSGPSGGAYLAQRKGATSEHVQALRASLFKDIVHDGMTVLDFGCGTGGVLNQLAACRRIGIEVGDEAAIAARAKGIAVYRSLAEVATGSVDLAISFHAIEHVDTPLLVLRELGRVLKATGVMRLVVPAELPFSPAQRSWRPNRDRHLFTWTPMLFGNLAERAGLSHIDTRLEPMPTGSRVARALRHSPNALRAAQFAMSVWRNNLNVVLNARSAVEA